MASAALRGLLRKATALAAALGFAAAAAQPSRPADAATPLEVTTITAKVEALDLANRVVAVKGPFGRVVALKVDDRVRNLAQVKVGDEIVLKYAEAVAAVVSRSEGARNDAPGATAAAGAARQAAAPARRVRIAARIEALDPARQVVLLEGANGRHAEVKVMDTELFAGMKPGENIEIAYAEAVVTAIVVRKK